MTCLNPQVLPEINTAYTVHPGEWYDAATHRPFQPGVYEVNSIQVTAMASARRYAFFDGVDFKPADYEVNGAHALRMCTSYTQVHPITRFRGLSEEV